MNATEVHQTGTPGRDLLREVRILLASAWRRLTRKGGRS
jgi:hypothetical protein